MLDLLMTIAETASATAANTTAAPQGGAAPQGNTMMLFGWIAIFGVMMFFMFRNQRKQAKQRQEMLNQIKAGDRIITAGGIYGTIAKVSEGSYLLEIADKVTIEVAKSGVTSVVREEATK